MVYTPPLQVSLMGLARQVSRGAGDNIFTPREDGRGPFVGVKGFTACVVPMKL